MVHVAERKHVAVEILADVAALVVVVAVAALVVVALEI